MSKPSDIIVLIPHFNDAEGLKDSLNSIREEIAVDVLIVDDGSDNPPHKTSLVENYTKGGLYLLILEQNVGIEHALNRGLQEIMQMNYPFIARLDCGDLCLPNRFKQQLDYMKEHPNIALLGTQVNYIDEKSQFLYQSNFPISFENIRKQMFKNCMLVHPTVMFRSEVINKAGMYPTNYKAAEDYAYFMNIIKIFEAENLPDVLVEKEVDDQSISTAKYKLQLRSRIRIILKHFYIGWYPIYGLIRNCILYLFPQKVIARVKLLKSKL